MTWRITGDVCAFAAATAPTSIAAASVLIFFILCLHCAHHRVNVLAFASFERTCTREGHEHGNGFGFSAPPTRSSLLCPAAASPPTVAKDRRAALIYCRTDLQRELFFLFLELRLGESTNAIKIFHQYRSYRCAFPVFMPSKQKLRQHARAHSRQASRRFP